MSRALLDVNVWLALSDSDHASHAAAHEWFAREASDGWASCAITQNGFVRIVSNPSYPNAVAPAEALTMLASATSSGAHEFWHCDIELGSSIDTGHLLGHRQITDAYLLALAVEHSGRFVTLDKSIPLQLVPGATPQHLVTI